MGRIAPQRRKRQPFYHPVLRMWMANRKPSARDARQEEEMMSEGTSSRGRQWLSKIWHIADHLSWMDPLPPAHRRGIIAALLVMLLAFLWPEPQSNAPTPPPLRSGATTEVPLQAELYDNNQNAAQQQTSAPPPPTADAQGQWRSYQVAAGQTLAQLFRDNNLPVGDVFAMAQVEGDDKPLSNLRNGQSVKIRQNASGVVTGLTVDSTSGPILFTRQPDGSFLRAQ